MSKQPITGEYSTRSFRQKPSKRIPVEHCPSLRIGELLALGALAPFQQSEWARLKICDLPNRLQVQLSLTQERSGICASVTSISQLVSKSSHQYITFIPVLRRNKSPSFKFLCPGLDPYADTPLFCNRRVDALYLVEKPGRNVFACSSCHRLTWLSRKVNYHRPRGMRVPKEAESGMPPPTQAGAQAGLHEMVS